ncbi:DNA-invertase hin [Anaerohalosphaera lusitana]|uniref:DNA-invertase hin n=1 Tax=Anaerohalosphaera lusitana TaxID=1936003 RepID=A0A1U9NJP8_9BACT|nr:recombinase family protein [Anaerohalosphaera lusitana]AQT67964.1 DNA-invertase hin [Anaerohalosphaera lusitana]
MQKQKSKTIRCAIYTRKSTEEGLNQEFNSLHAQREAAEAYIASQKSQGWVCLVNQYDDGGFTGGNMERPALKRLLQDIAEGQINCVVVYKVDRLSRSLMDFAKILARFEDHGVSFVSVTQQFNTTTSMGRLTLNVLLSFAQFEREVISERTRDKIAMARKRGKWSGGRPVLGYDICPDGGKLVINEAEAQQVRAIFDLFLKHKSILDTVEQLDMRGWTTKTWVTRKGHVKEGNAFNKSSLRSLLTNPLYIGKVHYKGVLYDGEHDAIVDPNVFAEVKQLLSTNRREMIRFKSGKVGGILKGLLRCKACDAGMSHAFSKKRNKRYRYYVCQNAQSRGWANCPHPSLPADEIERFVIDEIRQIGLDEKLVDQVVEESQAGIEAEIAEYRKRQKLLKKEIQRYDAELQSLASAAAYEEATNRLAGLQDRITMAQRDLSECCSHLDRLTDKKIEAEDIRQACRAFDPLWDTLTTREQWRMLSLLINRVEFDADTSSIDIIFYPTGIHRLNEEVLV